MLVLSRKPGEAVIVGEHLRVVVLDIQGDRVRIGLVAPHDIPIWREELVEEAEHGQ